jgi:hypothetical protein
MHCADTVVSEVGDMSSPTEIVTDVFADTPIVFDDEYTDTDVTQGLYHR